MPQGNKPVHRIQLKTIAAAVFANTAPDGKKFYDARIDRSYQVDGEWRRNGSYGRDDLLLLAKIADMANTWIIEQEARDRASGNAPEPRQ